MQQLEGGGPRLSAPAAPRSWDGRVVAFERRLSTPACGETNPPKAAQGYNGELAKVVAKDRGRLAYVVRKEGGTLSGSTTSPSSAKARQNAFIDYVLEPAVAARSSPASATPRPTGTCSR